MQRILFLVMTSLGAMMTAAQDAQAEGANCAARAQVVATLATRYGESRQSIALAADNSVVEVFASRDTGSWTITVTQPGGLTCLVSAGQAYQYVNDPLMPDDSGA